MESLHLSTVTTFSVRGENMTIVDMMELGLMFLKVVLEILVANIISAETLNLIDFIKED